MEMNEQVKYLAEILKEYDLTSIEVESEELHIELKKEKPPMPPKKPGDRPCPPPKPGEGPCPPPMPGFGQPPMSGFQPQNLGFCQPPVGGFGYAQVQPGQMVYGQPGFGQTPVQAPGVTEAPAAVPQEELKTVKAPLVGTFYVAPGEGKAPFVKVGDTVKKGQIIGIIEAMKLMNEIESDADGVVAEVLAENGKMVEYGAPLISLR
jgi:acetyl-CoA carboxylase biotin carboxyl carrier protein